ncbi:hypothetical protein HARCEL1_03235 [Halococcoides cellulosivorans]|uniref:Uncharacterized protein n=2 Tax=Halococcoides cellulosivorans TaxID=1679096 RepID=A0A2R4WZ27_9EURY|nr:hypothetical protein HARCEL1_03235 [Halococcoides cellulosivorans]
MGSILGPGGTLAGAAGGAIFGAAKGVAGEWGGNVASRLGDGDSLVGAARGATGDLTSEVSSDWTDFEMSEGLTGKLSEYVGMGGADDHSSNDY